MGWLVLQPGSLQDPRAGKAWTGGCMGLVTEVRGVCQGQAGVGGHSWNGCVGQERLRDFEPAAVFGSDTSLLLSGPFPLSSCSPESGSCLARQRVPGGMQQGVWSRRQALCHCSPTLQPLVGWGKAEAGIRVKGETKSWGLGSGEAGHT